MRQEIRKFMIFLSFKLSINDSSSCINESSVDLDKTHTSLFVGEGVFGVMYSCV